MWFDRKNIISTVKEFADLLQIVENIKALQEGQKILADGMASLGEQIRKLESDLRNAKTEIKLESLTQTQSMVQSAYGNLHERVSDLSVSVAVMQKSDRGPLIIDDKPLKKKRDALR